MIKLKLQQNLFKGFQHIVYLAFLVLMLFACSPSVKSWRDELRKGSVNPYGLELLETILKESADFKKVGQSFTHEPSFQNTESNYVFIGNEFHLGEDELDTLMAFVERGNVALIATSYFPKELLLRLGDELEDALLVENKDLKYHHVTMASSRKQYSFAVRREDTAKVHYRWHNFKINQSAFFDGAYEVVEFSGGHRPSVVKFFIGNGSIILHANPIHFTNYFLRENWGYSYTKELGSHLIEGPVLWDQVHHYKRRKQIDNSDKPKQEGKSPFYVFLGEESFKWAWSTLIVLILIYLMFGTKRRQRVIQLKEPNKNTSIEYAEAIAQIYFQEKEAKSIIKEMGELFSAHIRNKYGVRIKDKNDVFAMEALAKKTGFDQSKIQQVYEKLFKATYNPSAGAKQVGELYQLMNKFYKKEL